VDFAEDAVLEMTDLSTQPSAVRVPPAFVALIAPETAMERQARDGKVKHALIFVWICSLFLGAAFAMRVDARASTLKQIEQGGQMQGMSDRQIDDQVQTNEKQAMVLTVLAAAITPVIRVVHNGHPDFGGLLLVALAVVFLVWFLKGRVRGSAVLPVAAAVMLPNAIANVLDGITILRKYSISPDDGTFAPRTLADIVAAAGHPLMGNAAKLAGILDFYSLWAAVMMAFGVAAVGSIPVRRAVIGTLVAWVCQRLLTTVAMGGGHP
jgi:hypothetical protein